MSQVNDEELRELALGRIKKKRDLGAHVLAYVTVNVLLIGIWAVTGGGFFWPVFSILGWGIGLAFHALSVYRGEPSEAEIAKEIERLRGR